ncbi:proteoglycan 4-like [Gigantopelta aegis]|uniref:proteoglycan 4-like n=1 Tax=Gigantopelta aegis TaxID=1735272 RepID=UPI001B88B44E|nr:proteoglycan 4-like [Gigantopelta aegis]
MTEAIGGGAPLPPKRPTIIRSQVVTSDADGGTAASNRKAPARPAPPPPARPAPPQLKPPQEQDGDGDISPRHAVPASVRSSSPRRSGGSVKKRPEITIVGAQPMSQVGFRDEIHKGTSENEHHTPPPTTKPPDIPQVREPPPRPVSMGRPPRPSSRSVVDEDCPDNIPPPSITPTLVPSLVSPTLQPPRPSRPTNWDSDAAILQARKSPTQPDHDNTMVNKQALPTRPPRSPIVSPKTQQHNLEESDVKSSSELTEVSQEEQRKQPPRPSRPTIIRPKRPQRTPVIEDKDYSQNEDLNSAANGGVTSYDVEDGVHDGGAAVFSVAAKPQPRKSLIKTDSDSNEGTVGDNNDNNGSGEPLYAVINKKRPTSLAKPRVSPREQKVDAKPSADGTPGDDHALPFKVKLRPTVVKHTEPDPSCDGSERGSTDMSSKSPRPVSAKPKPLPKPKPVAKPSKQESWADKIKDFDSLISGPSSKKKDTVSSHTRKDIGSSSMKRDTGPSNTRKEISSSSARKDVSPRTARKDITEKDIGFSSTRTEIEIEDYENKSREAVVSDQIVIKRPTIIRPPPKPARVTSDDGDAGTDQTGATTPDSSDQNNSGPPLPARRPVSLAAAMFEQNKDSKAESMRHSQKVKKLDAVEQCGNHSDGSDESKSGPPLPARRPVSQTAAVFEQARVVKDESLNKRQQQKMHVVEQSANKDGPNEGPGRPSNAPVPRTRKSPSDGSEVKAVPRTRRLLPDSAEHKPVTDQQSPSSDGRPSPEPIEKVSPTSHHHDHSPQHPARPSGRPPPPKISTTQMTVTKVTVVSDALKGPPRPSGGPPRPAGPPPSPKASTPGRPSPPKSSVGKSSSKVPELPSRPSPGHPLYHYMMHQPHGIAQFDYTATQDDEISFTAGETVLLERRIDANWLVGKIGDKTGMFPAEFVQVIRPLDDEMTDETQAEYLVAPEETQFYHDTESSVTSGPRCIARFDFDGDGTDDLTFEEDDVIRLISTMGCDWMRGELKGKEGIFPIAFVDIIEPLPDDAYRPDSFFVTMDSDYVGKEEEELSFKAGDTIKLLGRLDSYWLIGESNTREGKFPASLVSTPLPPELPDYEPPAHLVQEQETESHHLSTEASHSDGTPFATALHDFGGEQDGDLSFQEGDRIELVDRVGTDWYRGRLHGKEGMFPAAFVHVEIDLPEFSAPDSPEGYTAPDHPLTVKIEGKALYDFEGQGNELSFKKGDLIVLGQRVSEDSDWQYGTLNGKDGMFPASFVDIL